MLLQFNVKNFMSIKNEVVLTAFANYSDEHSENVIEAEGERILSSLAIYGANAAGKTNVFKAFTNAILLVRTSNDSQINTLNGLIPFLFDANIDEKTKIDFQFINNGKKFAYGFTADKEKVYDE